MQVLLVDGEGDGSMVFYHGSSVGGLRELQPFLSEHGKPYIYFASKPQIALLYTVKVLPKPFSFYPYGFDKDGNVVYSEYFENAFEKIYKGKKGYLYECDHLANLENPTQINGTYTCTEPVKPDRVTEIPDVYEYYREQQEKGKFRIKTRAEISEKEMQFVQKYLLDMMAQNQLKDHPEHPVSKFIQENFNELWK